MVPPFSVPNLARRRHVNVAVGVIGQALYFLSLLRVLSSSLLNREHENGAVIEALPHLQFQWCLATYLFYHEGDFLIRKSRWRHLSDASCKLVPTFRRGRTFLPTSHTYCSYEIRLSHHLSVFSRLVVHGPSRVPPCWHFSVQVNQREFIYDHDVNRSVGSKTRGEMNPVTCPITYPTNPGQTINQGSTLRGRRPWVQHFEPRCT